MALEWLLSYLGLGVFVGFMAGLLGVGGGTLMVPVLTTLFLLQGMPVEHVVHVALGTSMASIILTSISSLRAHHARGGVLWPIVRTLSPGIVAGTFVATFIAAQLNSLVLAIVFALFMGYAALQMILDREPPPTRELPGRVGLLAAGTGIGGISAMVSIGGGSLTVPFLTWHNVDVRKAIGTAAAVGLPISVAGTLGYLVNGLAAPTGQDWVVGFVHWPAVVAISLTSVFVAPLGARTAHWLPVRPLKRIFAVLLLLLVARMLYSVM
ncbi:MAG: sulfite exporter TauE/SafE family protein [Natronospirillum sp.]|uniref:sulfite exporter TauE/SafE family protein n=1 Tax=Natronospirillum sp. TaxID=2812955 RepID=UPI0025DD2AB6|nr:sulfite exporter TauE/SafE family protein [Natronospirillum sp.]MCH8553428.1 sulfite exporter TauE/SafE family protein [Natronospirillum sp.]